MRLLSPALYSLLAVTLFAGCSAGNSSVTPPGSAFGDQLGAAPRYREVIAGLTKPATNQPARGLYVNQFYDDKVLAYQNSNTANNPPFCSVPTGESSAVNGIAVDQRGNLITPIGATYSGTHVVVIWQGPGMCGKEVGSFPDNYGDASNAASFDAIHGKIIVGNIFDNGSTGGSISICTLKHGCTANLTNPAIHKLAGVALDPKGNCWASAENTLGGATLTYFAGCAGKGKRASGFKNKDYGDLMFDRSGNLVSMDKTGEQVWVYSGCDPKCKLVGGPYPLMGIAVAGSLNHQAMTLAVGNRTTGAIDIYYYSPGGITYWYSFNNGISVSAVIEGLAYNPAVRPYRP